MRFVDFTGFHYCLFHRLADAGLYELEDVFDDLKLWTNTDGEMQRAYIKYLQNVDERGAFTDCGERYKGYFPTMEDFAISYVDEIGLLNGITSDIAMYFDYKAYARDLFLNGDFTYCNGYVFSY